ncbi:hypothetical protein G5714_001581 [Onychostoma macrolepis]|uniref:Uncharacterized protein n=1 Tax=Onychostoma macrolepis TaxID=369639 RepID=A0A7J6DCI4_9TELE|nr:hypothetical protein G5714_001581 [Onychostoma macrolepis]
MRSSDRGFQGTWTTQLCESRGQNLPGKKKNDISQTSLASSDFLGGKREEEEVPGKTGEKVFGEKGLQRESSPQATPSTSQQWPPVLKNVKVSVPACALLAVLPPPSAVADAALKRVPGEERRGPKRTKRP